MRQLPKPGEIYKHFKGNCYRIITIAIHAETGEKLVIYQALYGDYSVYARELSMFMSPVDRDKYPEEAQKMRFELLESGAVSPVESAAGGQDDAEAEQQDTEIGQQDAETGENKQQFPEQSEESKIDPMVLAYLDADTCKERLQILTNMKDRLTDSMINTMAIAIDVEIKPGDITERYEELKYCLATKERYECSRLR